MKYIKSLNELYDSKSAKRVPAKRVPAKRVVSRPVRSKAILSKLIDDIYHLNYQSNTFANKSHEKSLRIILSNNGFSEVDETDLDTLVRLKFRGNALKNLSELKGEYLFIEQPFGSQKAPDFIVCVDGLVLWIECKSGNRGKITWNTGYPKNNILYASSDKTKNTTTIFFGQFSETLLRSSDFEERYDAFDRKWKRILKEEFQKEFGTTNFEFYMRRMLTDKTRYSDDSLREDLFDQTKLLLGI